MRTCSAASSTRSSSPNRSQTQSRSDCAPARPISHSGERSASRLLDRQQAVQAKIDRGYDDYVEGRISDALWRRKSAEWETELATVNVELSALDRPATAFVATSERVIELVKRAGILYKTEDPAEQRQLLDSVLSNCTFDRGSLCPTYKSRSTCSSEGTKQESGVDGTTFGTGWPVRETWLPGDDGPPRTIDRKPD